MKQALLIASFGSSMQHVVDTYIVPVEKYLTAKFSELDVFRCFTSHFIRKKLTKNGIDILSPDEAVSSLIELGYERIVIQPLHIIPGYEFEKLETAMAIYDGKTEIILSQPLLYDNNDYPTVVEALAPHLPKLNEDTALIMMGHGTSHPANSAYFNILYYLQKHDENIYLANVDDTPTLDDVAEVLLKKGYKKVYLHPLLLVAGDHALNDMASDDEDSWKTQLLNKGFEVEPILRGLGSMTSIHEIFENKVRNAMEQ